jgi:flagellar biosynthetic protein FlhB
MSDAASRTIPATPRRRELARRQGMMPMANLPAWVAMVATTLLLLPSWAQATFPAATAMMQQSLRLVAIDLESPPRLDLLLPAALVLPTLALVAVVGGVGLTVRFLLDGSAWQLSRVAPRLDRISPLAGLARIFSLHTLASLAGHACGLLLLVMAAALSAWPLVAIIGSGEMAHEPGRMSAAAQRALLPLVAAAAVVAACTWAVSRLRFERRIRMTPEEYADEARSMQADPKVRLMRQQQGATIAGRKRNDAVELAVGQAVTDTAR